MNKNKIFYNITVISFIVFLFSCIKLLPHIFDFKIIGTIFSIEILIYIIITLISYLVKSNRIIKNDFHNSLSILLSAFMLVISIRYSNSVDENVLYFTINYILAMMVMLGLSINTIYMLTKKQ